MCSHQNDQKSMKNAYRIADELLKDRLRDVNPEAYEAMTEISGADVIVVQGSYDFIEQVLSLAETPFTLVGPDDLGNGNLRPDQIVFVNCPGKIRRKGLTKLERFVSEGGFLFTTDWALKHVIEPAFPGYIKHNSLATADEVVRVELLDTDDPFLKSLLGPNDDPQWWLEGCSYPIQIEAPEKVRVLVSSKEIEKKYGESAVFVTFDHGEGKVYHMISHFYLQRSETRTARHKASGDAYLAEKEISPEMAEKYAKMGVQEESLGDLESAYTSRAMLGNIFYKKRIQLKEKKGGRKEEK